MSVPSLHAGSPPDEREPEGPAADGPAAPGGPPGDHPGEPAAPHGVQGAGPGDERRRFPRAPIDLAVRLHFESVQQFMDATAEDISLGGIFLRSQETGPDGRLRRLGEEMRLQFDAGNRRMVEGIGRVVRVVPSREPGQVPGVGVEFVELDETGRRLIQAILDIKLAQPFG